MDERPNPSSRRSFLIGSVSGLSAAWVRLHWPGILAAQQHARGVAESGGSVHLEFFSPTQAAEVEAIAAQIIPSDNTPGAREARAVYFIDRALVTFERDKQPVYTRGLKELQVKVRELDAPSQRFARLTSERQLQILRAIENTDFFEVVRVDTIMGFLSNPEYGGNHDLVGWKLIGFESSHAHKPPFGYYDAEYGKSGSK